MLRTLAHGLLDLAFPAVCRLCDRLTLAGDDLCADCRGDLLRDPFASCSRCGSSVGRVADPGRPCGHCRGQSFAFEGVLRVGPYEGRRRDLVLMAKRDESAADCAARVFAEGISRKLADRSWNQVCAVPLHWYRAWRRQYNQVDFLARELAGRLGLPPARRILRRIRSTAPQTWLSPTARRENVRSAFRARTGGVAGQSVILVDDVLTTGATADAAATALREAGAARVLVAVLAHG